MAATKIVRKENRTETVMVRLRPRDKAELEERALELGMEPSVLLRSGWRYFPIPKTTR